MKSPTDLRPSYFRVLLTFARNSLVRDMTFRGNFVLQCITSMSWTAMNLGFYLIVFDHTNMIGADTGWGRYEFFVFLGTTWLVNSMVQAFFMPNAVEFSELIRTGNLDFALLKPIDTQFLVSFHKVDWASLVNILLGGAVISYAVWHLTTRADDPLSIGPLTVVLYLAYLACGVTILYSLMISLSATSIWMGRNQSLSNFWFYITSFSRYPMEIYNRGWGTPLFLFFTFIVPVLLVINVPARIMAQPLRPEDPWMWPLAGFCLVATLGSVLASRWIFRRALLSYRSASS
jgi:ABC-2 type transport system permease protein